MKVSTIHTRVASYIIFLLFGFLALGCGPSHLRLDDAPLPFRQAEDSFKLGHFDRAVHGYRIFIDSNQAGELIPRAYFKLAQAEMRLKRYNRCIATLEELGRRYPDDEWREVYELRGDVELARNNSVSAVHYWERALESAERPRRVLLRRRISDAIHTMGPESLMRARTVVSTQEVRTLIDNAMGGGGTIPVRQATLARDSHTPAAVAEPTPLTPVVNGAGSIGSKLGVLLPLSGKFAAYGKKSLNGIELALAGSGVELVVRDTAGETHLARAAFDELGQDGSVVGIIGPLRSTVAQVIGPRAERSGLPLLSLARNQGIDGRFVRQLAMTREMQAAQLAEYAIRVAGIRRFGVLFPRDAYGTALSDAFQSEIRRRGGRVVGAVAYEPGAQEFSVEVLSLQRWVDVDDLQAVFIPDNASVAGQLGSELREARPGVILLGSNGWHEPGQLGAVADALDGAVFVDGFFIGSQRPATQGFISAYRGEHGRTPGILEAQAYDAAMLARQALASANVSGRDTFVDAVQAVGVFAGATGKMVLGAQGVQRQLFILKLDGRRIREVVGAAAGGSSSVSFVPSRN